MQSINVIERKLDRDKRRERMGFIRSADRCGNCEHFQLAKIAHCKKGAFPTSSVAICNFHVKAKGESV